ncbi:fibronectin type III domain-containing protein [Flammeovirga kamogawensis]|nr:fibronectin type III domain-containing protein [Flammeovirga kamogawensis]MBB6462513.1 photosystem II stability/assembly factor-like uncharacterized protein [Flammeovirga kamogawensis]TRX68573.1 T9SS type A sorting domain-containing protein [Flammeovirga kamogawensis]
MKLAVFNSFYTKSFYLLFLLSLLYISTFAQNTALIPDMSQDQTIYHKFKRQKDDPEARQNYEHRLLENPKLHLIPNNIFELEHSFAQKLHFKTQLFDDLSVGEITTVNWKKRGPFNVGGRTRALAIDKSNENILLAGGVAGGLWRSINGGTSWVKVTTPTDRQSITCIAQDPRPNYANVWYYGAGEIYGNSASGGGATYRGNGIYKSTDGGVSWNQLSSTVSDPTINEGTFQYVSRIAVTPKGHVYVAHKGGISKSIDRGNSWQLSLEEDGAIFTEIMVTSEGRLFATIANTGFFTSLDGVDWVDITPQEVSSITLNRTVMDFSSSNPNNIYFFAHTPGNGEASHMLFKYNVADGIWEDRTENLPGYGGYVGDLSQGSYNQYIRVKPNNENVIFIGSTNLYRSEDGFTSNANTRWVGGYSPKNNVSIYPNHHPDNHWLEFLPSNPNIVITSHDGGISKTQNCLAENVEWEYLNNGYYTTQAYAIAIDEKTEGDNRIMAGFQDNGKWYTNSTEEGASWIEEYAGGDGCYVAIVPGEDIRYTSTQYGKILRFKGADPRNPTDYDGIQPRAATNQMFVHPYILDHNDPNVMYYPAGNKMWFNLSLDQINSGYTFRGTNSGWMQYTNIAANATITSLDVSTKEENILYFGTSSGGIYKVNNSRSQSTDMVDIFTEKGLPKAYVSCIAVNPKNAEHVLVVFSNYQTQSVFQTLDGGDSWLHVSGNLEENEDGSGAGPSVRWAAFHQPNNGTEGVFLGTSVGLFYASSLHQFTDWKQQAENEIGDAVVTMIKTREDGLVVIGTHSNGIYSAYFGVDDTPPVVSKDIENKEYSLGDFGETYDLSKLFFDENGDQLSFEIFNNNLDVVVVSIINNQLHIKPSNENIGNAVINVKGTAKGKEAILTFNVIVKDVSPTLVSQKNPDGNSYRSQYFTDFDAPIYLADDFEIEEGDEWEINAVKAFGESTVSSISDVDVIIWSDDNGKPSIEEVFNADSDGLVYYNDGIIEFIFTSPLILSEGKYWLTIAPVMSYSKDGSWYWKGNVDTKPYGGDFYMWDQNDLFRQDYTSWTHRDDIGFADHDLAFEIYGNSTKTSVLPYISILNAKGITEGRIELDWEGISEASGYYIERSTSPNGDYQRIATMSSEHNYWIDNSDKIDGVTYFYKVKGFNAYGVADGSPIVSAVVYQIPNAVQNLSVDKVTGGLLVEWEDKSNNETEFVIEYSLHPNNGYVPIATAGRDATSYLVSMDLLGSLKYYLRVAAANGAGKSPYQVVSSYTKLEAPGNIFYEEKSATSLFISWSDRSALETGFLLEYSTDHGNYFPFSKITDVNAESFVLNGLLPNMTYYFRLSAINGLLDGDLMSEPILFVHTMGNSTKPSFVTDVAASYQNQNVMLNWEDSVHNELGFKVYKKESVFINGYQLIAQLPYNTQEFLDENVNEGTSCTYKIESYNVLGTSESEEIVIDIPINSPHSLRLLNRNLVNHIQWKDASNLEDEYVIYRKTGNSSFRQLTRLPASTTNYVDNSILENQIYFYKVAAVKSGDDFFTETVEVSTFPNVPHGVTSLTVQEKVAGRVELDWTDDTDDEEGYMIYRKIIGTKDSTLIATVDNSVYSLVDNTAAPETLYRYYVISYVGSSTVNPLSAQIETKAVNASLPNFPINLIASNDINGVMLTWEDMSDNELGFEIFRRLKNDTELKSIGTVNENMTVFRDDIADINLCYEYTVAAYNATGYSVKMQTMYDAFENDDAIQIIAPEKFKARERSKDVILSWTDMSENEDGFKIYRLNESSGEVIQIGTTIENQNLYIDHNEYSDGVYTYYLTAFNTDFETNHIETSVVLNRQDKSVLDQLAALNVSLFPNPSDGVFRLNLGNDWEEISVDIFNIQGRKVYTNEFISSFVELNLEHLQSGQYIVVISNEVNSVRKNIIKK